jgi:hypothetical protein
MAYTARSSTANPWTPPNTQQPVGHQVARWKGLGSFYQGGQHFPLPYGQEPWQLQLRGLGSAYGDWYGGETAPVDAVNLRPAVVTQRLRMAMGALPTTAAVAKPAPKAAATPVKASPTSTKPATPAVATAVKTAAVKASPAALRPANVAQGMNAAVTPAPAAIAPSSGLFGLTTTELVIGGALVIGAYMLFFGGDGSGKKRR